MSNIRDIFKLVKEELSTILNREFKLEVMVNGDEALYYCTTNIVEDDVTAYFSYNHDDKLSVNNDVNYVYNYIANCIVHELLVASPKLKQSFESTSNLLVKLVGDEAKNCEIVYDNLTKCTEIHLHDVYDKLHSISYVGLKDTFKLFELNKISFQLYQSIKKGIAKSYEGSWQYIVREFMNDTQDTICEELGEDAFNLTYEIDNVSYNTIEELIEAQGEECDMNKYISVTLTLENVTASTTSRINIAHIIYGDDTLIDFCGIFTDSLIDFGIRELGDKLKTN